MPLRQIGLSFSFFLKKQKQNKNKKKQKKACIFRLPKIFLIESLALLQLQKNSQSFDKIDAPMSFNKTLKLKITLLKMYPSGNA